MIHVLGDPTLVPKELEEGIDEMMEEMESSEASEGESGGIHIVSAQHIWELADRNGTSLP